MTQKHKRPTAPASKSLPKKAAKTAAAHSSKEKAKAAHASTHSKDTHSKGKHVEKHVEVKKPLVKGKAPDKVAAPATDAKGKVVELKAAQKLAAARAAAATAAAPAPADGK